MWRSFTFDDPTREVQTQSMNEAHASLTQPTDRRYGTSSNNGHRDSNRIESGKRKKTHLITSQWVLEK